MLYSKLVLFCQFADYCSFQASSRLSKRRRFRRSEALGLIVLSSWLPLPLLLLLVTPHLADHDLLVLVRLIVADHLDQLLVAVVSLHGH